MAQQRCVGSLLPTNFRPVKTTPSVKSHVVSFARVASVPVTMEGRQGDIYTCYTTRYRPTVESPLKGANSVVLAIPAMAKTL